MGRAPCCDKSKVKRGPWSPEEDATLKNFIHQNGNGGNWIALPSKAGLKRCGKSCRLRWLNYLRPDIKHGGFTQEEDHIICALFTTIGSRWSLIASHLPGRTDNDVKNYWNTKLKKKFLAGKIHSTSNAPGNSESSNSNPDSIPALIEMGNYFCNYSEQELILDQTQFRSTNFMDFSNLSYGYSSITVPNLEDNCAAAAAVWSAGNGSSSVEANGIPAYFGFESLNCELLNELGFDQEIN